MLIQPFHFPQVIICRTLRKPSVFQHTLGGKCIFRQLYIKFWPNHDNSRQIRCMIYSTSSEALYIDRGRQPSVCEQIYILNHEFICNLNLPTQTFNHKVKGSWINQHCSYINGYSLSLLSENITIVWGRQ